MTPEELVSEPGQPVADDDMQRLEAALAELRDAGDVEGHPFHGNQWTSGASGLTDKSTKREIHEKLRELVSRGALLSRGLGGAAVKVRITDQRNAMRVAVKTADVLTEMKAKGYAMPNSVNIEVNSVLAVEGAVETTPRGRDLSIYIPDSIPYDADMDEVVKTAFDGGYRNLDRSDTTIHSLKDIIVHEMGHVNGQENASTVLTQELKNVARKVSDYATTNKQEFVAETFTRLYRGEKLPAGKKSMAYRIWYRSGERTLTDDEVNALHAKVTTKLKEKFGAEIR